MMKIYNFSLCYLGGDLDLVRLRNLMTAQYPGIWLDFVRGHHLMNVPLGQGTLNLEGIEIQYQIVCHQFDSGFGSLVTAIEVDHRDYENDIRIARAAVGHQMIAAAKLAYMSNVFGVRGAGDLFGVGRLSGERKRLWEERGINLMAVGLNEISIGIQEFDCYWLTGQEMEEVSKAPWRDISGGSGQLMAADNNRFWSPGRGDELYWDVATILLREHMGVYLRTCAEAWVGYIRQQLDQIREDLCQKNQALLSQEHDEIERMEINFLSFGIMVKTVVSGQAFLRRRASGPASLRIIEPEAWAFFSRFGSQKALIEELVAEGKSAIERMRRHLDFSEFKLLKTSVERLEYLIVLLIVLLVIMELFAQFAEPGRWRLKNILTVLLIAIPGFYALWSLVSRSRAQRRSRRIYLKHQIARMEEGARNKEEQNRLLRADSEILPETREHYIRMYEDIRRQFIAKAEEYKDELKKLR